MAKASLEELLLDYEDYLRQHNLPQWDKSHPRTLRLREYLKSADFASAPTKFADRLNPEEYCNLLITLINQATYLLRRLIDRQQQQFLEQGGIKEQMYRARVSYRSQKTAQIGQTSQTSQTSQTGQTSPSTPSPSTPSGGSR